VQEEDQERKYLKSTTGGPLRLPAPCTDVFSPLFACVMRRAEKNRVQDNSYKSYLNSTKAQQEERKPPPSDVAQCDFHSPFHEAEQHSARRGVRLRCAFVLFFTGYLPCFPFLCLPFRLSLVGVLQGIKQNGWETRTALQENSIARHEEGSPSPLPLPPPSFFLHPESPNCLVSLQYLFPSREKPS
jgi:hypothetical protein